MGLAGVVHAGPSSPPAGNYIINVSTLVSKPATNVSSITVRDTLGLGYGTQGNLLYLSTSGVVMTTTTTPAGGDVFKASTQTFTGANTFLSSTTFNRQVKVQTTGAGQGTGTGGSILVYATNETGMPFQIYTSSANQAGYFGLINLIAANTNYANAMIYITGTSSSTAKADIYINNPRPNIQLYQTGGASPYGQYEFVVVGDTLQFNSMNSGGSAQKARIGMTHPGALAFYETSDNGHFVALKASATIASNVTWVMPPADGSAGQLIATDGAGNLSFISGGGGGGGSGQLIYPATGTPSFPFGASFSTVTVGQTGDTVSITPSLFGNTIDLSTQTTSLKANGTTFMIVYPPGGGSGTINGMTRPGVSMSGANFSVDKGVLYFRDQAGFHAQSFRSSNTISTSNWVLPPADASGCWQSDGAGNLSISACPGSATVLASSAVAFGSSANGVTSDTSSLVYGQSAYALHVGSNPYTGDPTWDSDYLLAGSRFWLHSSSDLYPIAALNPFSSSYYPLYSTVFDAVNGGTPTDTSAHIFNINHSSNNVVTFNNSQFTTSGSYQFKGISNNLMISIAGSPSTGVSSITIPSLIASMPVQTGVGKNLISSGLFSTPITVSSSLTVTGLGGIVVTSTSTFNGNVSISSGLFSNGSTGTNGQILTSGGPGTIPTWTGTLAASIASLGASTGTLQTQIDAVAVSTGILSVSTASLQSQISGLGSTYLTNSSATATYLQSSSATATYLSIPIAASTYLTQSSATITYLQTSSATATYFQKTAIIPIANGGTNTASTLTGIVRGGAAYTASELSGDATTSGSNAVTLAAQNGNLKTLTSSLTVTNAAGMNVTYGVIAGSGTFQRVQVTSNTILGAGTTIYADGRGVFGGTLSASNLSGTNTGDQTITLTGDVTGSGTGSFAATLAPIQANMRTITSSITITGPLGLKVTFGETVSTITASAFNATTTSMSVTGSGGFAVVSSSAGQFGFTEGAQSTVLVTATGIDSMWGDSTSHTILFNPNNTSTYTVVGTSVTPTYGQIAMWGNSTGGLLNSPVSISSGGIVGTKTNDNAAAGNYGEYISSIPLSNVTAATSGQYYDIAQILLTPGDWDINTMAEFFFAGGAVTMAAIGIGTVAGNNSTNIATGNTYNEAAPPTAAYSPGVTIPAYRVSLSANTTYYLKGTLAYGVGGAPSSIGRISARRPAH